MHDTECTSLVYQRSTYSSYNSVTTDFDIWRFNFPELLTRFNILLLKLITTMEVVGERTLQGWHALSFIL